MRIRRLIKCLVSLSLFSIATTFGGGCAAHGPAGNDTARPVMDEVTADESVTIRALTEGQLRKYTDDTAWPEATKTEFNDRVKREIGAANFGIDTVAGLAVSVVFDLIKSGIAAEAAKHERQFGSTLYGDGFWAGPPAKQPDGTYQCQRNVCGFEIVRHAGKFADVNRPAFRCVCIFKQNAADKRMFLIRPLCLEVNGSKAKVSGKSLKIKLDIALDSTWIDKSLATHASQIALSSFEFPPCHMDNAEVAIKSLDGLTAGWFAGVPVSVNENGVPVGDGVYALRVNVTETDASAAKENIEKLGRLIEDQRSNVSDAVKKAVQ